MKKFLSKLPKLFSFLILSGMVSLAHSSIIFDQTMTGSDLFSDPNVTLHSSASVNGNSIDLSSNTIGDILLNWVLLGVDSRGELNFAVTVDFTPTSTDNDPTFAISDGSSFQGTTRGDNNNGTFWASHGSLPLGTFPTNDPELMTNLGSVEIFTFTMNVLDNMGGTAIQSIEEGIDSLVTPYPFISNNINTDNILSFTMFQNNANESYTLNSVRVVIEDRNTLTVPEPTSLALLGLGLACFGLSGKKKRAYMKYKFGWVQKYT